MRLTKRIASLLAAGALLATPLVGMSAAEASANSLCGIHVFPHNKMDNHADFSKDVTLRREPYSDCTSMGVFAKGQKFYIWCAYKNAANNWWYFGRISGTDTAGWVYEGNLTNWSSASAFRGC
ncbi:MULTISPECIES: hypothetical protein [unclassified Streptomyces]|uniref:hypothetical protein n=1 Tax=unclassified Streptomyces TaxID=2593676 RepID=UPI0030097CFE